MKVFRGPASTTFEHDTHELVSRVKAADLEEGIKSGAKIRFNISKVANDRQAVCTVCFEESDILPMIRGLLERLAGRQDLLSQIAATVNGEKEAEVKVRIVQKKLASFSK